MKFANWAIVRPASRFLLQERTRKSGFYLYPSIFPSNHPIPLLVATKSKSATTPWQSRKTLGAKIFESELRGCLLVAD